MTATAQAPGSRSARKRQDILDAAAEVFLTQTYLGATMDQVAARAGVSKQTVYKHFKDKESLFTEIITAAGTGIDEMVRSVAEALDDVTDLHAGLTALGRQLLTGITRPEVLALRRLVIGETSRFPDLGRQYYEQGFARVLASLAACLQRLVDRRVLRPHDTTMAADQFAGLVLWIPLNHAVFTGDRLSTRDLNRYATAAATTFMAAYRAE